MQRDAEGLHEFIGIEDWKKATVFVIRHQPRFRLKDDAGITGSWSAAG